MSAAVINQNFRFRIAGYGSSRRRTVGDISGLGCFGTLPYKVHPSFTGLAGIRGGGQMTWGWLSLNPRGSTPSPSGWLVKQFQSAVANETTNKVSEKVQR